MMNPAPFENLSPLLNPSDAVESVEDLRIPVIEEILQVGKRVVETGRVVIAKTITERDETVSLPLNHEEVTVDRVLVNRYVDTAPAAIRYEGDTMIVSVLEEVVVVEKRLMLVEELHVTKRQVQTQETRQVTLRKENITVTRQPGEDIDISDSPLPQPAH